MNNISVMIPQNEIIKKVEELGNKISSDYKGKKVLIISVLNGAFIFTADLIRNLSLDIELRFIRAKSYSGTESTGEVTITDTEKFDVKDKEILIVEDIIDTGRTLKDLKKKFLNLGCKSVKLVTFLDKPSRRVVDITPDYCCYKIEDKFVVGYGLDFEDKYRQLPFVGVIEQTD